MLNLNNGYFSFKKILLIKPNYRENHAEIHYVHTNVPPLNLTFIASYLADLDVEIDILDAKVKNLSYNKIRKKIKKFNPDIVGITVFVSASINICYNIAKIVKEINQNTIVVFGGRHFISGDEHALNVDEVDIIIRGEGELTFRELIIKGTPKNVKGIYYKSNGKVFRNPDRELIKDFNDIRYPARQYTNKYKYKILTVRMETVQTSRGCPYKCKFCITPNFNNGLWRPRSIEKIINELKIISQNKKITDIFFIDDNFTANTKRIENLCERIIECKRNKKLNDFNFIAQVRVDSIVKAPQMVKRMAEAGFWIVFIGIESVSKIVLKDVRKGFLFNKVLKAIKILHKNNIIIIGNLIIGLDLNAREEDTRKEIRFMKNVGVDLLSFTVLTPFPGTDTLKELEKKNLIITKDWSKYTLYNPVIKTHQLSAKKLQGLLFYSFKEHCHFKNLKHFTLKIIKKRGYFFTLNPKRFIYCLKSYIMLRILIKKFFRKINKN